MPATFAKRPCPWNYFPDNPEIQVTRLTLIDENGLDAMYSDCFSFNDTTYFMNLYIHPDYRNNNWRALLSLEIIAEMGNSFPTRKRAMLNLRPEAAGPALEIMKLSRDALEHTNSEIRPYYVFGEMGVAHMVFPEDTPVVF